MKQKMSNSSKRARKKSGKLDRLKSHYPTLELLNKATPELRKAIISKCGPDLLKCISEVAVNVLRGNLELPDSSAKKLKKHSASIRKVASKRVSVKDKKKIINQKGGFLLPLLAAVLPTLASLLTSRAA